MAIADSLRDDAVSSLSELVGPIVEAEQIERLVDGFITAGNGSLSSEDSDRFNRSVIEPLRNLKVALLVVDFQNDFVSGSLSIKAGDAAEDPVDALPELNRLVEEPEIDMVVYTQDWHPHNHISFYEHARNSDRELSPDDKQRKLRPFDIVRFEKPDTVQVLYPSHCVQGSWGAQLHPQLNVVKTAKYLRKGMDLFVDSYSAFGDNHGKKKSELEHLLKSDGVSAVLACGLAYDICVMHTLKDAANLGFLSAIIVDCSKGLSVDKIQEANELFAKKGVAILTADEARDVIHRNTVPFEWAESLAKRAK